MNRQDKIASLTALLGPLCEARKWQIVLAESCSGGGIAYQITKIPGSSKWLKYSLVTYTDEAKQAILGVDAELLSTYSAVSSACAMAMLQGLDHACVRLAVTGYCGPGGDALGRVYIAYAPPNAPAELLSFHFRGTREDIQTQVIFEALKILIEMVWQDAPSHDCFFGLGMADASFTHQVYAQVEQLGFSASQLEPMSNAHMTLAYFSNQAIIDIERLIQQGDSCASRCAGFELSFQYLDYVARADAWVLRAGEVPKALTALAACLGATDFSPHLTLSKRCQLTHDVAKLAVAIPWVVQRFSLFISFHGIFYKPIKTWNLETKDD